MGQGLDNMEKHKVIIIGENNSSSLTVGLEVKIANRLRKKEGNLHIILQHFNFEMQYLIDDYLTGKSTFEQLVETYKEIGTEGYDI
jgi:uncharacterized iron-regulated protein